MLIETHLVLTSGKANSTKKNRRALWQLLLSIFCERGKRRQLPFRVKILTVPFFETGTKKRFFEELEQWTFFCFEARSESNEVNKNIFGCISV